MIPPFAHFAKSISTAAFAFLLMMPFSQVQAKNHWTEVFNRYFQPSKSVMDVIKMPVARAQSDYKASTIKPTRKVYTPSAKNLIKVDLQPVTEPIEIDRVGPVRRFKKVEEVSNPKATTKVSRYLDFVVPPRLISQVLSHVDTEKTKSKIVTPRDTRTLNHKVSNQNLRSQGIRELIGVGVSNFEYSSYNRAHNIRNAVSKFDGLIIPQGEEFSFNSELKNAGPSNGFLMAKIISQGMTKYGWGGGVCQLSTTMFRSAFNSGLPITARRNHTFKVPYYGRNREEQGMDATIYLGGQDLKFVNDTPGDIMMQMVEKDDYLMVFFYGTKDRTVSVNGPDIDGLTYEWSRTISKDGERESEVLTSKYQREVFPVTAAAE